MKYLRWATAAVIGLYAASGLPAAITTLAWKMGWTELSGDMAKLEPLMAATSTPLLVMWFGELALYALAAWNLLTLRGGATRFYIVAFAVQTALWTMMKSNGAYDQAFSAEAQAWDWWIMAAVAAVGVLTWWLERREKAAPGG
jgi:hypothetical protein